MSPVLKALEDLRKTVAEATAQAFKKRKGEDGAAQVVEQPKQQAVAERTAKTAPAKPPPPQPPKQQPAKPPAKQADTDGFSAQEERDAELEAKRFQLMQQFMDKAKSQASAGDKQSS